MTTKALSSHEIKFHPRFQQRRLRHLRSVLLRNLVHSGKGREVEAYFIILTHDESEILYKSEKITARLNCAWRHFSFKTLHSTAFALKNFVIQVFVGRTGGEFSLHLKWSVHLDGLVHIGNQLPPPSIDVEFLEVGPGFSAPRCSYSTGALSRIQTMVRAISQTQHRVRQQNLQIEEMVKLQAERNLKRVRLEEAAIMGQNLKSDLSYRLKALRSEKDELKKLDASNGEKAEKLSKDFEDLLKHKEILKEKKKKYVDEREEFVKNNAQLVMRRKQLISELACIYPVIEIAPTVFTIGGVKLPHSEDFQGQDDQMLSVSLGSTAHMVLMAGELLDVPLRYPIDHRCSRSHIHDHIMDKLSERERDFPLYGKGKDKVLFDYGVFLLNRNVAQLRYYCGLGTSDLRMTLPNLKTLLELRLGVKFENPLNPKASAKTSSGSRSIKNSESFQSLKSQKTLSSDNSSQNRETGEKNGGLLDHVLQDDSANLEDSNSDIAPGEFASSFKQWGRGHANETHKEEEPTFVNKVIDSSASTNEKATSSIPIPGSQNLEEAFLRDRTDLLANSVQKFNVNSRTKNS